MNLAPKVYLARMYISLGQRQPTRFRWSGVMFVRCERNTSLKNIISMFLLGAEVELELSTSDSLLDMPSS